MQEI
ncbi:uncharacterized protein FFNC_02627 [Fusarium fujikuroi]|jgi:hypothetical protein